MASSAPPRPRQAEPDFRLSSSRLLIVVSCLLGALHLWAASTGGLLDPAETERALAALQIGTGEVSTVVPVPPTADAPLTPPLSLWLGSAGVALFGTTTMGARLLPALTAALLLLVAFIALRRALPALPSTGLILGAVAAPAYLLHAGQIGPAALTAAALIATSGCSLALVAGSADRWQAIVMGACIGLAALSGGLVAGLLPLVVLVALTFTVDAAAPQPRRWFTNVTSTILALIGVGLLISELGDGRAGWPTMASLGLVGCASPEVAAPVSAWLGAAALAAALVVLRQEAARQIGLHLAVPVALLFVAPWLVSVYRSPEAPALCDALVEAVGQPWATAQEVTASIRRLGYGLYPLMAFLPLSVLRITGSPRSRLRLIGATMISWAAMALALALVSSESTLTVSATSFIGALCVVGLLAPSLPTDRGMAERVAMAVGAMLALVVLHDLRDEPALLPLLALPRSATTHLEGHGIIAGVGALSILSLVMLAFGSLEKDSLPAAGAWRFLAKRGELYGRGLALLTIVGVTLLTILLGLSSVGRAASWAEVFNTYANEHEDDEPLYGWKSLGDGGRFYAGRQASIISRARDLRRVLMNPEGEVFFATETTSYRQLAEMVHRLSGHRLRPLNDNRRYHVIAVYEGPALRGLERPPVVVDQLPRHARRSPAPIANGAVKLVGVELDAEHARPGDTISLKVYLEPDRGLSRDHQIELRLEPDRSHGDRHQERHDPTDDRLPTSRWRPGQIIEDQADFVIPTVAEPGRYSLQLSIRGAGRDWATLGTIRIRE